MLTCSRGHIQHEVLIQPHVHHSGCSGRAARGLRCLQKARETSSAPEQVPGPTKAEAAAEGPRTDLTCSLRAERGEVLGVMLAAVRVAAPEGGPAGSAVAAVLQNHFCCCTYGIFASTGEYHILPQPYLPFH